MTDDYMTLEWAIDAGVASEDDVRRYDEMVAAQRAAWLALPLAVRLWRRCPRPVEWVTRLLDEWAERRLDR